jgi:hypothetical protein
MEKIIGACQRGSGRAARSPGKNYQRHDYQNFCSQESRNILLSAPQGRSSLFFPSSAKSSRPSIELLFGWLGGDTGAVEGKQH